MNFQHVDIPCRRDGGSRKISLRYSAFNGKIIYAPANGCDYLDGSVACRECLSAIDHIILRDLSEPVDFSCNPFVKLL